MSDERNEFEYEENGNNNNSSGGFDNENNYSYQTVRNFGKPKTMGYGYTLRHLLLPWLYGNFLWRGGYNQRDCFKKNARIF